MNANFTLLLRQYISLRRVSPYQVSDAAAIDRSTLSRLLNGRTRPTLKTVLALARALHAPEDEFLRVAGLMPAARTPAEAICVSLPRPENEPPQCLPLAIPCGEPARAPLLLIVDDHADLCLRLAAILSANGYRTRIAHDGVEAWEALGQELPALILLDIEMPRMDGLALCERLRQDPYTRAVLVLFISVRRSLFDKAEAFGLGGDDYICKPFEAEELLLRVAMRLRQARRLARQDAPELWLDRQRRYCRLPGRPKAIMLSEDECKVLAFLLDHPDQTVPARVLMARALGYPMHHGCDTSAARRIIARLRGKLEPSAQPPRLIRYVRPDGYRLCPQDIGPEPPVASPAATNAMECHSHAGHEVHMSLDDTARLIQAAERLQLDPLARSSITEESPSPLL